MIRDAEVRRIARREGVEPRIVELGTIVWPNDSDLDPDVLYADGTPAWAEGHGSVS